MVNINFVPDDYIQTNESRRTNLMYIVLFMLVMTGLGGAFFTIKMRERALDQKEKLVNQKLTEAEVAINQYESLQEKRKEMMKTALTTAELLETVPRSVLLASLTNDLPGGVSLLRLQVIQKEPRRARSVGPTNRYQKARADKANDGDMSREKLLETLIDIEGVAPSDRQVAAYIQSLSSSSLLVNVALVESKEHKIEDTVFRRFKLTAMLGKQVHLTKEDIEKIKTRGENSSGIF
ncbi:MAG: PilN domain-containing protein [Planctomycetota bacterium]